ncbi:MAG TPA: N-acetylmuramoyl-L-alanine amidase [Bacteroidia bacterium]|nr:N-acetylmuramoyl-L-alanine amidase [Bacteroidia bacterium]
MQYASKCALIAIVFCETLLISVVASPLSPYKNKKWVVVIDAGHGGKDPGCHGRRFKEKDVALSVALKLGHLLEENDDNVKVIYTRSTDVFIPLNERADIANRNHADFFICVHCNASKDKDAFGAATYVMGLYKAEGNLEVSKRENSSVLLEKDYKKTYNGFDPNSPEGNILFSMYQNMYLEQSLDLSAKIQKEYANKANRTDNGVKQAGFLVLWKTAMPSLLTEIGFLTNPQEENYIGSQKGQNKTAECIFYALQEYIDEKEGVTFKEGDFKLNAATSDTSTTDDTATSETPDTTTQAPVVDTPKVKAAVQKAAAPKPVPVKPAPVDNTASENANKMKASVKELHADSAKINTTKYVDDSTKIVYKIQITTASQPLAMDDPRFKDIPDVEMYFDKTVYKYTAGHYYTMEEADKLQTKLRSRGFKDAFVIAFKGKNRVVGSPTGKKK